MLWIEDYHFRKAPNAEITAKFDQLVIFLANFPTKYRNIQITDFKLFLLPAVLIVLYQSPAKTRHLH